MTDERQWRRPFSGAESLYHKSRKGTGKQQHCKQCNRWIVEVDASGRVVHIRGHVLVMNHERYEGIGDSAEPYPRVIAKCRCGYLNGWPVDSLDESVSAV